LAKPLKNLSYPIMIMKINLHLIVLAFFTNLLVFNADAQSKTVINEENERMILAYSFYLKQKMSLEFVAGRFPNLKDYVESAMNDWNREFIPSVKSIDSVLTAELNDEWHKNKDALYEKYIRIDYSGISEQQARQFVDEVNDRSYGHIQSPILETLLMWNPEYRQFPEKEFTEGYVSDYSTQNERDPVPLKVKVIYPKSWKADPGNRKINVIRNFISGYGLGPVTLSLIIEKSKSSFTSDRIAQLLSREALQKGLTPGYYFLNYQSDLVIDNCNAASILLSNEKNEADSKKTYFIIQKYVTYYRSFKISLNFTISAANQEEADNVFKQYQKLFKRIINNVVILSQWGQ